MNTAIRQNTTERILGLRRKEFFFKMSSGDFKRLDKLHVYENNHAAMTSQYSRDSDRTCR